jgi:hypothetical protein
MTARLSGAPANGMARPMHWTGLSALPTRLFMTLMRGALVRIHGFIRPGDKSLWRVVATHFRHTNGHGDRNLPDRCVAEFVREPGLQFFKFGLSGCGIRIPQQQPEFITAKPPDNVRSANTVLQNRNSVVQNMITDIVTMAVIDLLEIVQIAVQQRRRHPVSGTERQRPHDIGNKSASVQNRQKCILHRVRLKRFDLVLLRSQSNAQPRQFTAQKRIFTVDLHRSALRLNRIRMSRVQLSRLRLSRLRFSSAHQMSRVQLFPHCQHTHAHAVSQPYPGALPGPGPADLRQRNPRLACNP